MLEISCRFLLGQFLLQIVQESWFCLCGTEDFVAHIFVAIERGIDQFNGSLGIGCTFDFSRILPLMLCQNIEQWLTYLLGICIQIDPLNNSIIIFLGFNLLICVKFLLGNKLIRIIYQTYVIMFVT